MDQALRIVNLEDNPLDTELVRALLRKDGLPAEIDRVDTLSGFQEALRRDGYGADPGRLLDPWNGCCRGIAAGAGSTP